MSSKKRYMKLAVIIILAISVIFLAAYGIYTFFSRLFTRQIYGENPLPSFTEVPSPSPQVTPDNTPMKLDLSSFEINGNELVIKNCSKNYNYSVYTFPHKLIIFISGRYIEGSSMEIEGTSEIFEKVTVESMGEDSIRVTAHASGAFTAVEDETGSNVIFRLQAQLNKKIVYRNSTSRTFLTLDGMYITDKRDSENKYYTASYSEDGLVYTMKFEKSRMKGLADEKQVYNDSLLNYFQITSDNDYVYMVFKSKKKLVFYPNTRDTDSTLTLIDPENGMNYIVIDPGHGGMDPGSVYESREEKVPAFMLANKLKDLLEENGYSVYMLREEDIFMGLNERVDIANLLNARLYISIHCNSYDDTSVYGTLTLYEYHKDLAVNIQQGMVSEAGVRNMGAVLKDDLLVLGKAAMPAVLIEAGFITNTAEWEKLNSDEHLSKLARGITKGIDDFLKNQ
jgi:N-acetylmuramoyl-L-alanine amidase